MITFTGLERLQVHFVGIKGTGMAALAELFHKKGAVVTGSDVADTFYTDAVLNSLGIPYANGFDEANIPPNIDLVIYSAAYDPRSHRELLEAQRRNIPIMVYTEALGMISEVPLACGIAGVHGKTTTTAMIATMVERTGLPASVLVGSAVSNLADTSTVVAGDRYFIAETCEYKRHFLAFYPDIIVVTSIEADHLDYFQGYEDIFAAFLQYAKRLPEGGTLIYCSDDTGAASLAKQLLSERPDIHIIPYGHTATGPFTVIRCSMQEGETRFSLQGVPGEFVLHIPGYHSVLNATAAIALISVLLEREKGEGTQEHLEQLHETIQTFRGSKRRSEIIGEAGGVIFMDDYGHHPTAIRATLAGLKEFYPQRRLIVDFMSHTYSRTKALLHEFARSFDDADLLILHKIYASARENATGSITGEDLCEEIKKYNQNVQYFREVMDAEAFCRETLKPGDLFITMGAGDNWRLGRRVYRVLLSEQTGTENSQEASP